MEPVLRASEMDRRIWCPGSRTIEAITAARQGDEGDEGSLGHWQIMRRLCDQLGALPPPGPITQPKACKGPQPWVVEWAAREIKSAIPEEWSLETEVPVAYEFGQFVLSGHMDVLGTSPDGTEAIIYDWKLGRDPVDAAECNEQILSYIVLAKRANPDLAKVTARIAQPYNNEDDGYQRISEVVVEGADALTRLVQSFEERVNDALAKPMSLSTGKHCRYCSASPQCPAIIKIRQKMKHELTPAELAAISRTPNDAVLGDWAVDARTLEGPIKDAKELLHARLDAVETITAGCGQHISRKIEKGAYEVEDPPAFYRELSGLIKDPAKRAMALRFSMTAIKDVVAEVYDVPKTGKAAITAEGMFDAKLRIFTKQGERRILRFS